MAINWSGFLGEVQTNVLAVWPEVKRTAIAGGGLWELNEIERASQLRIAFPYAVYEVVSADTADWGLTNSAFEVKLEVHYIDREPSSSVGALPLAAIRSKLDLLRARFLHTGNFTTATVLDVDLLDWTGRHPALAVFTERNVSFMAGGIQATFVIGEFIS